MNDKSVGHNRRDFIKTTAAATTALAAMSVPRFVHAGTDETLKYGLIGCGRRGSGAAVNAMEADPQRAAGCDGRHVRGFRPQRTRGDQTRRAQNRSNGRRAMTIFFPASTPTKK